MPPTSQPTVVYTDGSAITAPAVGAFFVDRHNFAAVVAPVADSFSAELAAIELALDALPGSLIIHSDHQGLVRLLRCQPTNATLASASSRYPTLVRVRELFDAKHCRIHYCPGHGTQSPMQMRFADQLSRGICRRVTALGLTPGDRVDHTAFAWPKKGALLPKLALALCRFDQGDTRSTLTLAS